MGLFEFKRKSHKDVVNEIADDEVKLEKLVLDDLKRAKAIVAHLEKVKLVIDSLIKDSSDLTRLENLKSELKFIDKNDIKTENVQQELMFLNYIEELLVVKKKMS